MEVALVFGSIEKDKAKEFLPKLVDVASPSVFERAVASLQNSNLDARASATDILVALHELDIRSADAADDKHSGVSLKSLVNVCNTCFSANTSDYFTFSRRLARTSSTEHHCPNSSCAPLCSRKLPIHR